MSKNKSLRKRKKPSRMQTVRSIVKKESLFTAVYEKRGKWYVGYVEEISGVNTQGRTLAETKKNLQEALELVLETNRILSRSELHSSKIIREPLIVTG